MIFTPTLFDGVFVIELEKHDDSRGFFARAFCKEEFAKCGLCSDVVQCNISYTKQKGTVRGIHYQKAPWQEVKLMRCCQGRIFDVAVDLRQSSSTYGKWYGMELSAQNGKALYIPKNFANGYMSLEDSSIVYYQASVSYHPDFESSIRWNDPDLAIRWPIVDNIIISDKDSKAPLWREI